MAILKEVMSRDFETLHPDGLMKDAIRQIERLNLSVLLICRDQRVEGVLMESDLRRLMEEAGPGLEQAKVGEFMSRDVLVGYEEQDVRDLVGPMRLRGIPVIPVLDGESRMVGLFTLGGLWKRRTHAVQRR